MEENLAITEGTVIDNDETHWSVTCPECERYNEFWGYFDPDDKVSCRCGKQIKVTRIKFSNGDYIGEWKR